MCGILGLVASPGTVIDIDQPALVAMRDTMAARGPDASGLYCRRNVALAHRRLAIRDLAGGAQPWVDEDEQTVLVYNGELYNDAELKRELEALGYRFRTRCDTEVVMAAYRAWGTNCVQRFRGMFALGIYDFRDDTLFLARDRFGIKPLFLANIDGTFAFASGIPALLRHPGFTKRPNFAALSHYLTTFRLTLGRETCFAGIEQLLPGEILVRQSGTNRIQRYWEYPVDEDQTLGYDDAVEQLHGSLHDAVQRRLVSDVPVGMFLSGGVDSSTLACLVHRATQQPLLGICGGGEAEVRSEDFAQAKLCAAHVGFEYGEVRLDARAYLDRWRWLVEQYGTPVSTPSDIVIFEIAAALKPSVGVALGGEGADELLCGYAVQHWAGQDFDAARRIADNRWTQGTDAAQQLRDSLRRQYGIDSFHSETDHYFALNSLIPSHAKPGLLQPHVWQAAAKDAGQVTHYQREFDRLGEMSTSRKHLRLLHQVNLEALLSRLDSATMSASLEARVPYTDHALVEQMFRVPQPFKIDVAPDEPLPHLASADLDARGSLRSKRILRSVASRLMPESLAQRRKASFPTPVATWLTGEWQGWARQTLLGSPFARDVFQEPALRELADHPQQAGMWLWPLLNISLWGDQQF